MERSWMDVYWIWTWNNFYGSWNRINKNKNMEKFEIFVLRKNDGIFNKYNSVDEGMAFLNRTGHLNSFSLVAHKGKKSIFFDKIDDIKQIIKELYEFQRQNLKINRKYEN